MGPLRTGSPDIGEENLARALKRPRLVWTSQLHARFVDAVKQLGLKSAVPKTIMQVSWPASVLPLSPFSLWGLCNLPYKALCGEAYQLHLGSPVWPP